MYALPVEIVAVFVGLVAAGLGYAFREYRNRISPLFEIIKIETTSKRNENVTVDKPVVERLNGSFYVGDLRSSPDLGDVFDRWDRCDDLRAWWPETKRGLEAVIASTTDDQFKAHMADLLPQRMFSEWLLKLLLNGKLDFKLPDHVKAAEPSIPTWIESQGEEQAWFDLTVSVECFGRKLNHPAIRGKCMPFIEALSHCYRPGISVAFQEYIRIFEADYVRALACIHELRQINDENERWAIRCFLANTSLSPIVIERRAWLTVVDKKKPPHREPCYLAVLDKEGDLVDTDTPVVLGSGEGKIFAVLTSDKQKDMQDGDGLRLLFNKGEAHCRVSVTLCRPGLFKRQRYRSTATAFSRPRTERK